MGFNFWATRPRLADDPSCHVGLRRRRTLPSGIPALPGPTVDLSWPPACHDVRSRRSRLCLPIAGTPRGNERKATWDPHSAVSLSLYLETSCLFLRTDPHSTRLVNSNVRNWGSFSFSIPRYLRQGIEWNRRYIASSSSSTKSSIPFSACLQSRYSSLGDPSTPNTLIGLALPPQSIHFAEPIYSRYFDQNLVASGLSYGSIGFLMGMWFQVAYNSYQYLLVLPILTIKLRIPCRALSIGSLGPVSRYGLFPRSLLREILDRSSFLFDEPTSCFLHWHFEFLFCSILYTSD